MFSVRLIFAPFKIGTNSYNILVLQCISVHNCNQGSDLMYYSLKVPDLSCLWRHTNGKLTNHPAGCQGKQINKKHNLLSILLIFNGRVSETLQQSRVWRFFPNWEKAIFQVQWHFDSSIQSLGPALSPSENFPQSYSLCPHSTYRKFSKEQTPNCFL